MLAKLGSRLRRTSSATIIAIVALVFAMGGFAAAGPKGNKDEVTIQTATGGPVVTTSPNFPNGVDGDEIPLTNASFVQRAGEAVLVTTRAQAEPGAGTEHCGLLVAVTEVEHNNDIGTFMEFHTDKGDIGTSTDADTLPAPLSDTTHTLRAFARESDIDCDAPDSWTVNLTVTVVTLRP